MSRIESSPSYRLEPSAEKLPLEGITVVDLSSAVAGPMAGQFLGDFGARVIKVERIEGDLVRILPPHEERTGVGLYFASANRNKESIGINYGKDEGIQIIHALVREADVVLVNIPAIKSMEKYGLDISSLAEVKKDIIQIAISCMGHTGPNAGDKGYDLKVQALMGSMKMTGSPKDEHPHRFPGPFVDVMTAYNAFSAVLLALRCRDQSLEPQAQFIDVSLINSSALSLFAHIAQAATFGEELEREGDGYPFIHPYSTYESQDGYITLALGTDNNWATFMGIVEEMNIKEYSLLNNPCFSTLTGRVNNREALDEILKPLLETKTAEEWEKIFVAKDAPASRVRSVLEFVKDPQTQKRGVVEILTNSNGESISVGSNPLSCSGLPMVEESSFPPSLGENTDEILSSLGYSDLEVTSLRENGVVL